MFMFFPNCRQAECKAMAELQTHGVSTTVLIHFSQMNPLLCLAEELCAAVMILNSLLLNQLLKKLSLPDSE